MLSWFIFAHATDTYEEATFYAQTRKIIKNNPNTRIWIFYVYSKKIGKLFLIENGEMKHVFNQNKKKMSTETWCGTILKYVMEHDEHNKFGLVYYGHAGSIVVGPWVDPTMSFLKFTQVFMKRLKPLIFLGDACLLGSIESLYEMAPYCRFFAGSPSYHPYQSFITLESFARPTTNLTSAGLTKYVRKLSCEFNSIEKLPNYGCVIAFDLKNLREITKNIKNIVFKKENAINNYQYDLADSVIESGPRKKLKELVINKKCMQNKCPKKIHGITISTREVGESWNIKFSKMAWGKLLKKINTSKESKESNE